MRSYRTVAASLALVLALSIPASAGIMSTDKASPTPTPTVSGIMSTDAPEDAPQTDEVESMPGVTAAVKEIALNLLQSVLTLF